MNTIYRIYCKIISFCLFVTIAGFVSAGSGLAEELELDIQSAEAGETVVFTVSVNNAPNLMNSFDIRVLFDGDCLTWQSLTKGELTQDFDQAHPDTGDPTGIIGANEPWPGTLIILGATGYEENGIQPGESGEMLTLTFTVDSCCSTELAFSDLDGAITPPKADHIWTTKNGHFFCGDEDIDGILDADDNCMTVSNPAQTDTDNDGYGDVCDNCPGDPDKLFPGVCGCGNPDTDTDSDGVADCIDECPDSAIKTTPGVCGCDIRDNDSDLDGTPNCIDECPSDRHKTVSGECGCGTLDTDTDGDGTADCNDECPDDPAKTVPGTCGCGIADTDANGDGTPDCIDANDDSDGDGSKDKKDNCPDVANPDQADADADGTGDACDECPDDPNKIATGECGCGNPDTDTDGDGTADCNDLCPKDMDKTEPGVCGCHKPDIDRDGDGDMDCRGGSSGCFMDTIGK